MSVLAHQRILAISLKEWRLNSRFLAEYIANNVISPVKTALIMYFLYAGFLKGPNQSLGVVTKENFSIYVMIGTTCHSLLMSSIYVFRSKLTMEKWWQTITATLISPASTFEMIVGFILGSGTLNLLMGGGILSLICLFQPISISAFLTSLTILFLMALAGFGLGLLGATIALCWEGKSWIFDYTMQGLIFLSCFYYPLDTFPAFARPLISILPTFHAAQTIHELYLYGSSKVAAFTVLYLALTCIVALFVPAILFERSLKKYGVVGY